jgi:hypothetical protein
MATTHPSHRTPRTRARRRWATVAVGGLAVTALLTGACGSDDDAEADTTTTHGDHADAPTDDGDTGSDPGGDTDGGAGAGAPLQGEPVSAESCGAFDYLSRAMTADPDLAPSALERFEANIPPDLTEQGAVVVESLTAAFDGDEAAFGDPAFVSAFEEVGDAMWAGCEVAERLDVAGVDYGFEGLPETVAAGLVALRFTNQTSHEEPHELIVLQRPPGDELPLDEIAELGVDEVMADFPMIGVAFADAAGTSSTTFMELPTGSYIAICTIPVGGGETGDPHSSQGMIAEFEVA